MTLQSHSWTYMQRTTPDPKGYMHPSVHCSTVYSRKTWKQPKCSSTGEWVKKMWCVYLREYYSAIEKNEIMPFATTWMDLESVVLSEVSQKEEKYHMTSLIYGI